MNVDENGSSIDARGNVLQVGDRLKCIKTEYYFLGQCREDRIKRGSIVTIEFINDTVNNVRDRRGFLFFKEHANRYGPWSPSSFVKT